LRFTTKRIRRLREVQSQNRSVIVCEILKRFLVAESDE